MRTTHLGHKWLQEMILWSVWLEKGGSHPKRMAFTGDWLGRESLPESDAQYHHFGELFGSLEEKTFPPSNYSGVNDEREGPGDGSALFGGLGFGNPSRTLDMLRLTLQEFWRLVVHDPQGTHVETFLRESETCSNSPIIVIEVEKGGLFPRFMVLVSKIFRFHHGIVGATNLFFPI